MQLDRRAKVEARSASSDGRVVSRASTRGSREAGRQRRREDHGRGGGGYESSRSSGSRGRVKGYLVQALEDREVSLVLHLSPSAAWAQLKSTFEYTVTESYLGILSTLHVLSASKKSSIPEFISKHEEILSRAVLTAFPLVETPPLVGTEEEKKKIKHLNLTYSSFILNGSPKESKWEMFKTMYKNDPSTDWNPRVLLNKNPKNPKNRLGDGGGDKKGGGGEGKGRDRKGKGKEGGGSGGGKEGGGNGSKNVTHVTFGAECALVSDSKKGHGWYLDSGSSVHITKDESMLSNIKPHSEMISCAEGGKMKTVSKGDVKLENTIDGRQIDITIRNVNFVPESKWNLISLPTLSREGATTIFYPDETCEVQKGESTIFSGSSKENGIYKVEVENVHTLVTMQTEEEKKSRVTAFHRKMGHPGKGAMRDLLKSGHLEGCSTTDLDTFYKRVCPPCIQGKSVTSPFPTSESSTTVPFAKVHSNIAGPMNPSHGGSKYFILVIDEGTGYVDAEPMKERTEVTEKFERILTRMKIKLARIQSEFAPTTILQTDNGTEYLSHSFQEILPLNHVHHQTSITHIPQQNGKAERTVRSIKDKICTILSDAHLSSRYWAEALPHAIFLLNRLPSLSLNGRSPYLRIHETIDTSLEDLPVFGQNVWVHLKDTNTFDPKAVECRFLSLGTQYGKKGFRIQRLDASGGGGIGWTRDVYCSKDEAQKMAQEFEDDDDELEVGGEEEKKDPEEKEMEEIEKGKGRGETRKEEFKEDVLAQKWGAEIVEESEDVGLLVRKTPKLDLKNRPNPTIPTSPEDAITSIYSDEWVAAMEEEMKGMKYQEAWKLVEKSEKDKILGSRWHYSIKHDQDGGPKALKARLVVQGCKKIPWLAQLGPRSAPLVSIEVVFLFYTFVASHRLHTVATDLTKGYLAAPANLISSTPILMKQPPLFVDPEKPNYVCQLRKALYGLPQSGRAFFHRIKKFVNDLHLVSVSEDVSLCYGIRRGQLFLFLSYSDDGLIASKKEIVEEFLQEYRDEFDLTVRGGLDGATFLGREIGFDTEKGLITVGCRGSIRKVLEIVGLETLRPLHSPIQKGIFYTKHEGEPIDQKAYLVAVGHLQWIAPIRIDIAFAVNVAARFSSNPGKEHWGLIERILSYLKATMDVRRTVGGEKETNEGLVAYVDADFAGDIGSRRSTTGALITYKGSIIAHLEWLSSILSSLPNPSDSPIVIHFDNRALFENLNSPKYSERNKNVDIKIKYVQEQMRAGFIDVRWISTEENLADLLTKALPATRHRLLSEKAGLIGFGNKTGWGSH
ncbi:hypothetical protein JCM16303_002858 [Sporobolomyces ruberrimus]